MGTVSLALPRSVHRTIISLMNFFFFFWPWDMVWPNLDMPYSLVRDDNWQQPQPWPKMIRTSQTQLCSTWPMWRQNCGGFALLECNVCSWYAVPNSLASTTPQTSANMITKPHTCRSWWCHSVNKASGRQLGWGYRVARLKGRSGSCSTLHLMGSQQFQTSLVAMEMSPECNQLLSSDYLWIGLQCFDGNVKPLSMDAPHAWCNNDWCLRSCMLYV